MGRFTDDFAPEIPRLRRYLALYYRRERWADAVLRQFLTWLSPQVVPMIGGGSPGLHFFRQFILFQNSILAGAGRRGAAPDDVVMPARRRARHSILLVEFCGFTIEETAFILGQTPEDVLGIVGDEPEETMQGVSVLIVEDDMVTALDLSGIVTALGHRVTGIAATEKAALALAEADPPDILMCDVRLGDGGSGIDAARRIGETGLPRPLIYITANPSDIVVGPRAIRPLVIGKPYRRDEVRRTLDKAISRSSIG